MPARIRVDHLMIGGGVAANSRLRQMAATRGEAVGVALQVPRPGLCTDNGAMVAALGATMVTADVAPTGLAFRAGRHCRRTDIARRSSRPLIAGNRFGDPRCMTDDLELRRTLCLVISVSTRVIAPPGAGDLSVGWLRRKCCFKRSTVDSAEPDKASRRSTFASLGTEIRAGKLW